MVGILKYWIIPIAFVIAGYLLKTRLLEYRLKGIVDFIMADIKNYNTVEWNDIDEYLEETLKFKWGAVIKRGCKGYYLWLEHKLGYSPTYIKEEKSKHEQENSNNNN